MNFPGRYLSCRLWKSRLLWWTGTSVSCVLGCFSGFWPSCKEISCRIFPCIRCFFVSLRCASSPFPLIMCVRTRPREIHNVGLFPSVPGGVGKTCPATRSFPATYKNLQKILQKRVWQKLQDRKKCVPLQPLSRGRAAEDDRLVKRGRLSKALHPSILPCKAARERETDKPREVLPKNFFEKTFGKIWRERKNALPLQTLSRWNGSTKER